ncbi:MAG: THUMP domain-containing protein [Polyangia bacterium]
MRNAVTDRRVVRRDPRAAGRSGGRLFATTAAGLEEVLARELRELGAREVRPAARGVAFCGDAKLVYRANLWLRTALRVLRPIAEFDARDRDELYKKARAVRWSDHTTVDRTLAVDAVSHRSRLDHTQYVSRLIKDAIVDWFRDSCGRRPSVDARSPDLGLNVRLNRDRCTLSVDTSGARLNRRGYRPAFGAEAPLAEHLAAGILLLSGYEGGPLLDPMCGSGTLLVEAALIGTNTAPGLLGRHFGFQRQPGFDRKLWRELVAEARGLARRSDETGWIDGSDVSEEAVRAARAAASGAGVDDVVRVRRAELEEIPPRGEGHVVTNPPYGERLGELAELAELYGRLGDVLKQRCRGTSAHVLTGSRFLAGKIGLRPARRDPLWNGPIECRLLHYDIY